MHEDDSEDTRKSKASNSEPTHARFRVARSTPCHSAVIANGSTVPVPMSSSMLSHSSTQSSNFLSIFDRALDDYKKKTGKDILANPLANELQHYDSAETLAVLQAQAKEFKQFKDSDQRLIELIKPIVGALSAFHGTFGGSPGIAFPPSTAIITGISTLLNAATNVSASYDALVELFERIGGFFNRLGVYSQVSPTAEMIEVIVKIFTEILSVLSIATKEVTRKRASIFFRKLMGRTDIQNALRRLDFLVQEETRMVMAYTMKAGIEQKEESRRAQERALEEYDRQRAVEEAHQQRDLEEARRQRDLEEAHRQRDLEDTYRQRALEMAQEKPHERANLTSTNELTSTRGSLRPPSVREPSPVRKAAEATQPFIPILHDFPQSPAGRSALPPAIYHDDSLAPTTSAPALFPFDSRTPSRSRSPVTFSERGSGYESDGVDAITPVSTLWNQSKPKRSIPIEQTEGYINTRSRAIKAIGGAFGTVASIGHEALSTGVDLLQLAPLPGLQLAGNILLKIWDAVGMVKTNRVASLRLTERCEEILISIRAEIDDTSGHVAEELRAPIAKLLRAFTGVQDILNKLGQGPFLKRFLGRDEIESSISACDTDLSDALGMFRLSIQIRTLNTIQANELRRQRETHNLLASLSHLSSVLPPVHPPLPPAVLQPSPADPESVQKMLQALRAAQNSQDRARDAADLRQLMRTALDAKDDLAMFEVLQVARSEMPEAIEALERARERVVEDGQLDTEESTMALPPPQQEEAGTGNGTSQFSADTLDREFIETGIVALRRLSKCSVLGLPSWTIKRFEIKLEGKVGVGSFSDVYRGTWRNHTVAVKLLAEMTPSKIFVREVEIWKLLRHPNVLELLGASGTSGEPPWFLVSKYYMRGSLVKYLNGLSDADAVRVDALKMIHEISEGMAYLHKQGVRHGDLKAANILVDDDTCCVISDFGQSEMKSEVYRMTRPPQSCGTLRWQAPELMEGAEMLTPEMDVYAFAICCGEILTMGAVPWAFASDDNVRHFVLNKNMRPSLPQSTLVNSQLTSIIYASWDRDPLNRPSFEQISHKLNEQRADRELSDHQLADADI